LQDRGQNQQLYLRLAVEGGGCSGFKYIFKMEDTPLTDEDKLFERDGSNVIIDEGSFELVKGSTIDYVQEMMRSAFAVTSNPQSETACGCGSSFAMKNFTANPAID
jgi:iron-sulfur cluster assembly accessory protein